MKATQRDFNLSSLILSSEQTQARTPGVHVSAIVRKIASAMGKKESTFTPEQMDRFAIVGRLWERTLADALFQPPRYQRIGEIECDGIIGSPDCYDVDDGAVLEFKVTWVSWRDFEGRDKWYEYLLQIKSYCCMVGAAHARLIVLFVCGNWRDDPCPRAIEWELSWTAQELKEHWAMMKVNGRTIQ